MVATAALAAGTAPHLAAQRVEIAARVGVAAATGTQFELNSATTAVRSWDAGGPSAGAAVAISLSRHFGVQAVADLVFLRHHATMTYTCSAICAPINVPPGPLDANATNLIASLRWAARQDFGDRLQLGASVGPAMVRFGDAEYQPSSPPEPGAAALYALAHRAAFGVAVGVRAAFSVVPRFRVSVSADDLLYRVPPAAASTMPGWTAVVTPIQHLLTLSVVAGVTVP